MSASPRRPLRRAASACLLAAVVLTSAACGSEQPTPTVSLDEEPSAPASPTPSETSDPAAAGEVPEVPPDGVVTRGRNVADSPAELEVTDRWYAYWDEVLRMYRSTEVDRDTLYSLATGDAAEGPLDYVARMRERGDTQRGGVIAAVTAVRVDGRRAVVEACFRDDTQDVARNGRPAEVPAVFFTSRATLRQEGPDWRVVESVGTSEGAPCDYR